MSLAFGRHHLAIPGPSVMPDRVLCAMHRPAPNIYAGELPEITEQIKIKLKALAQCSGDVAIYIGNGHSAWEASICNTFSRGDRAMGLVNGRFGSAWLQMANELGVQGEALSFGATSSVDPKKVEEALIADKSHEIKAVMTVQTDTSTGIRNDIEAIRAAIDAASHPALLMVDCIASFGCEPFDMDALGVDLMVCASQKGLMTPPGLSFMYVGEKFWAAHAKADLNTPYWNCQLRIHPDMYPDHFCGTPPTHHLYGVLEALTMLEEEGKENVWKRHDVFAEAVWAAVDAWSKAGTMQCSVADKFMRSTAVTAINTTDSKLAIQLRDWCESVAGVTLGVGLSPTPERQVVDNLFRIGHMGHLNPPMLMGTLGTIEAGLCALGSGHGSSALNAAAAVIAKSQ